MVRSRIPCRLWDHCIELACLVQSPMALDLYKLQGQVPVMIMMGQTADISFICLFKWYNWIYYNDSNLKFPDQKVVLGRYLGHIEPEAGSVFTGKILTATGEVIRHNTFRHLTDAEIASSDNQKERDKFDERIGNRCGVPFKEPEMGPSLGVSVTTPDYEVYDDDKTEIDDVVGTAGYGP
jgi:hypothetical protein